MRTINFIRFQEVSSFLKAGTVMFGIFLTLSSCYKPDWENPMGLRPGGINFLLLPGDNSVRLLKEESVAFFPELELGTAVFENINGEELRFTIQKRKKYIRSNNINLLADDPTGAFVPEVNFRSEGIEQVLKGDGNDLEIFYNLDVIPYETGEMPAIDFGNGILCADFLWAGVRNHQSGIGENAMDGACAIIHMVSSRGFEALNSTTRIYSAFEEEFETPEGVVLHDVYSFRNYCEDQGELRAYYRVNEGIIAFRDFDDQLWLFDRIE